jgi:hypothetical protein
MARRLSSRALPCRVASACARLIAADHASPPASCACARASSQRVRSDSGLRGGRGQRRQCGGGPAVGDGQFGDEQVVAQFRLAAQAARLQLGQQRAGTRIVAGIVPGKGGIGLQVAALCGRRGSGEGFEPGGGILGLALVEQGDGGGVFGGGGCLRGGDVAQPASAAASRQTVNSLVDRIGLLGESCGAAEGKR